MRRERALKVVLLVVGRPGGGGAKSKTINEPHAKRSDLGSESSKHFSGRQKELSNPLPFRFCLCAIEAVLPIGPLRPG